MVLADGESGVVLGSPRVEHGPSGERHLVAAPALRRDAGRAISPAGLDGGSGRRRSRSRSCRARGARPAPRRRWPGRPGDRPGPRRLAPPRARRRPYGPGSRCAGPQGSAPPQPERPGEDRCGRSPSASGSIAGEPARVSELRRRFEGRRGERFDTFVERQGVLALERAEREIVGGRYKVPRLVHQDIVASAHFRANAARLAEQLGREAGDVTRGGRCGARGDGGEPESSGHRRVGPVRPVCLPRVHARRRPEPRRAAARAQPVLRPGVPAEPPLVSRPARAAAGSAAATASPPTTCSAATTWTSGRSAPSPGATATCSSAAASRTLPSTRRCCASTSATSCGSASTSSGTSRAAAPGPASCARRATGS